MSKRYKSWITSPVGPLLAAFASFVAIVYFTHDNNRLGVMSAITFTMLFSFLALFNWFAPDYPKQKDKVGT